MASVNLSELLNLSPDSQLVDRAVVRQVKLFAPTWDAVRTRQLKPILEKAKALVMTTSLSGLGDDEILADIQAAWPDLGVTQVSRAAGGSCMVLDAT